MTKLLIDECLSAEVALMARQRGHHEASHVLWIGKGGWKDWKLRDVLLSEDWVLVTWNCADFRGPREAPGTRGQCSDTELHAGLICLDATSGMNLALQRRMFDAALDELQMNPDLTNQVLEVTYFSESDEIELDRYAMPV